jgi:phosphohistidine phosphatase
MELYLLRHGDAGDHAFSPDEDNARRLTSEGNEKTKAVVRAAKKMNFDPPQLIVSSPLVRAEETAKIAIEYFAPKAEYRISEVITPGGDMDRTMAFIAMCAEEFSSMMLVGHDPHLSSFASILVSGSTLGSIEMKKSMLALFSLTDMDTPRMRGTLRLLLPPKIANLKF